VPLAQPCNVWVWPDMLDVALWSVDEVDGLCAVEFWSVVDGVVDGCAGCDADGVVDCELDELGWL